MKISILLIYFINFLLFIMQNSKTTTQNYSVCANIIRLQRLLLGETHCAHDKDKAECHLFKLIGNMGCLDY